MSYAKDWITADRAPSTELQVETSQLSEPILQAANFAPAVQAPNTNVTSLRYAINCDPGVFHESPSSPRCRRREPRGGITLITRCSSTTGSQSDDQHQRIGEVQSCLPG